MAIDPMAWIKVADDFYDHPKFLALPHDAVALWLTALAWCNRHRTDGVIPAVAVSRLGFDDVAARALVDCGLWTADDAGWCVHDYTEWQTSAQEMRKLAQVRSDAGRKGAASRWQHGKDMPEEEEEEELEDQDQDHLRNKLRMRTTTVSDAGFDAFWAVYPRKKDRRRATQAWKTAIRRADPAVIIAGAKRYADDPNRVDEFTKHPTTWLNADAWDNEAEPRRGTSRRGASTAQRAATRVALEQSIARRNGAQNGDGHGSGSSAGSVLGELPERSG